MPVNDGIRVSGGEGPRKPPLSRRIAIGLGLGINLTALGLLMQTWISRPVWLCLFVLSIVPYVINNTLIERRPADR